MDEEIARFRVAIELHDLTGATEDLTAATQRVAAAMREAAKQAAELAALESERMDDQVIGIATTSAVDRNGNYGLAEQYLVAAPPDALAFVPEGFCPNCQVPLAGDTRNWCPSCKATWHIRRTGGSPAR